MAALQANHYFSPRKFASANRAREILDSLRLSPPTVAPGQTPGALRFVSLALHILPQKGGRHRRNVSARNVSELLLHSETHFSTAPLPALRTIAQEPCSTQQAWMYSRNQTTIASCCKHRQPVFLHPTFGVVTRPKKGAVTFGGVYVCEVLRKELSGFRQEGPAPLTPPTRLNLPIPLPASTLQVFQFICYSSCTF
jgi:hypothetical protein